MNPTKRLSCAARSWSPLMEGTRAKGLLEHDVIGKAMLASALAQVAAARTAIR
jgi:hypothetical protein